MLKKGIVILIPAYEPDISFVKLIFNIKKDVENIIVVDDGSGEKYRDIFEQISDICVVLHHSVNLGKGCALKTGFSYIKNHFSSYIVVTMDCDGQHTISDALSLAEYNQYHMNSLVLGSRKLDKRVPMRSKFGNVITRFIFFLFTGVKVYDTQTGLRSFSDELMDFMLSIDGDRFEYEINVLLQCTRSKVLIHEEWIQTIYLNNNAGSHFETFRDSFKIYKQIFRFLFHQ